MILVRQYTSKGTGTPATACDHYHRYIDEETAYAGTFSEMAQHYGMSWWMDPEGFLLYI